MTEKLSAGSRAEHCIGSRIQAFGKAFLIAFSGRLVLLLYTRSAFGSDDTPC